MRGRGLWRIICMMRAHGTSPLLISVTVVLLGCVSGRRGDSLPPLPAAWSVPACYIADTSARTADTLYVAYAQSMQGGAALTRRGAAPMDQGAASIASDTQDCAARDNRPSMLRSPVVISLAVPTGMDLRDVLDLGVAGADGRRVMPDVIVARDPDVIAYARRRGLLTSALPWERTYVLSSRTVPGVVPTAAERDALSRDAITADSRGAEEPFAWLTDSTCALPRLPDRAATAPLIAYSRDDRTARQLAERVVSLARMRARPAWVAAALSGLHDVGALRIVAFPDDSIVSALELGEVSAAILSAPRDPSSRCGTRGDATIPAGAIPLVDTRAHVIIRRGSGAAVLVAPNGSLRVIGR